MARIRGRLRGTAQSRATQHPKVWRAGISNFVWKTVALGNFNYENIVSAWIAVKAKVVILARFWYSVNEKESYIHQKVQNHLAFQQMELYSAVRGWEETGAGGIIALQDCLGRTWYRWNLCLKLNLCFLFSIPIQYPQQVNALLFCLEKKN